MYKMRNEKGRIFTDLMQVVIIELPKVPKEEDGPLWAWLQFFKCKSMEECQMLVKKHPELKKAAICVRRTSLSDRLKWTLFTLEMQKRDEREWKRSVREEAQREAREEAQKEAREEVMEKGREKGFEEVARNALAEGATIEFVQKITGLDLEAIKNIQAGL